MPIFVLLVLLGVVAATALALRVPGGAVADLQREWRNVQLVRAAALLVGALAAWPAVAGLSLGRGAMLVPAILGLAVVTGVAAGEAVVRPAPPVGRRTASLRPRRVRDYLPTRLAGSVLAVIGLHAATLALTTLSASADGLGRAGRQVSHQCGDVGNARGPYPGSYYTLPLAALLLLTFAIAAVALFIVIRRPRGFASDDADDDLLRHRSVTAVLAAVGAAVAASHAGIAYFAGHALSQMDCAATWMNPVGVVLLITVPVAILALGWFLGRLLSPGHAR